MFVAWELYDLRDLAWFSVLDLHYADPAQPLATAGGELDDLDRDLSDLSDLSYLSGVWNNPISTSCIKHKTPNFVSHECRMQQQLECHIFGTVLTAVNSGRW